MLLFRLSAEFELRLAERQFSGLLFQLPPRSTRAPAHSIAAPRATADFGHRRMIAFSADFAPRAASQRAGTGIRRLTRTGKGRG